MLLNTYKPANSFWQTNDFLPLFGLLDNQESHKNQTNYATVNWQPNVDICTTEKSFLLRFELPGIAKEDLDININNGLLTISGEKKPPVKDSNKSWSCVECFYGSFSRSFTLNINVGKIEAHYENGLLNLTIPRVKEDTTSIKIT